MMRGGAQRRAGESAVVELFGFVLMGEKRRSEGSGGSEWMERVAFAHGKGDELSGRELIFEE
jgi:hypothetical protein